MTDPTPTRAEVVHRMARNMITSHTKKALAEWGLALEAENQALRERAEAAEADLAWMTKCRNEWQDCATRRHNSLTAARRAEAAAWNDAIEAAALSFGYAISGHSMAGEVIADKFRALRRAAPTEDR